MNRGVRFGLVAASAVFALSLFVACGGGGGSGGNMPTQATMPGSTCRDRANFGDPAASLYVLPYPPGTAYTVLQSYCGPGSHSRDDQLAYDFLMGFGDEIVAARGGIVTRVVNHWTDDDKDGSHFNFLNVLHEDGTEAFYAHFKHQGVSVEVGQAVSTGDRLGAIGETGTPTTCAFGECGVLHFGVYSGQGGGADLPVNFRNAEGPLDERRGLRLSTTYAALPH
jgi:murein DD-endopeptidase MepM/ murein hydrolase activator NlpD